MNVSPEPEPDDQESPLALIYGTLTDFDILKKC